MSGPIAEVKAAFAKMKMNNAAGLSGVVSEMLKLSLHRDGLWIELSGEVSYAETTQPEQAWTRTLNGDDHDDFATMAVLVNFSTIFLLLICLTLQVI